MIFKGSGVAIVTPFKKDMSINYTKMEELINYHLENKTDAIIVCGTTGESSTLSNDEKKELIKFVVEKVDKKIPVIAGTGSNNTKTSCEMSEYASNVGCDGVLIVTPYYNKTSQEGLIRHYKKIASSIPSTPIILYNVPSRTGVDISVDTIQKLSKVKNIVGIKEASTDITKISKIIYSCNKNFNVYSGNDDLTLPILCLGGSGVISVVANICPKDMHNMCKYYFDNNVEASKKIHYKLLNIMNNLFSDVNPICIKQALNELKFDVGDVRLPLCKTSKKNIENIKNSLKSII